MMSVKDYYKILDVEPSADFSTIKKAFRKLAMQYHPDKNEGSPSSTSYYREIQIAYEVLSNSKKREEYHYKRWLEKSKGYELDTAITVEQIVQLFINTERVIHEMDSFWLNNLLLLDILLNTYNANRTDLILEKNDAKLENTVIALAFQSSKSLSSSHQLKMIERMNKLLKKHPEQHSKWNQYLKSVQQKEFIEKLKIPAVILLTILLCLIILMISK